MFMLIEAMMLLTRGICRVNMDGGIWKDNANYVIDY